MKLAHGSLFSGIGGFDLASQWMGWDNVFHCEMNKFCQRVLKYHFPNSIMHNDITKTDFSIYRGTIDITTGGFPCQPYSVAGNQLGTEDERHLWPEMLRAICEIETPFVVGENVPGLVGWNSGMVFEQVQNDLENKGYEVWPVLLPAAGVEAPHERSRVWFIAYSPKFGASRGIGVGNDKEENEKIRQDIFCKTERHGDKRVVTNTNSERRRGRYDKWEHATNVNTYGKENGFTGYFNGWPTQPPLCFRDDGISDKLDGITFPKFRNESIKAAGNAIVPQVALQIFKSIEAYINL